MKKETLFDFRMKLYKDLNENDNTKQCLNVKFMSGWYKKDRYDSINGLNPVTFLCLSKSQNQEKISFGFCRCFVFDCWRFTREVVFFY
jgi:hypothetical protein